MATKKKKSAVGRKKPSTSSKSPAKASAKPALAVSPPGPPAGRGLRRPPETSDAGIGRLDLRRIILELAVQVAPTDIEYALANGPSILARAGKPGSHLSPGQIKLALDCVSDYTQGTCPQIPLYTISLLTAALQYLGDQIDLVPDFLPRLGDLDDAAVFAVAMAMARPGVLRYCDATERHVPRR